MRYFIYLSYDGKDYHGWQIQPNGKSVQEVLEHSLSTILRSSISVVGAGRTDAGVNASEMVAHFDCEHPFDRNDLCKKLNKFLPRDISIHDIRNVRSDAHARFDAISRTYKYYILTKKHPLLRHYSFCYSQKLDYSKMNSAAQLLFEYKDFTSFSKLHTDTKTNICEIKEAQWRRVSTPFLQVSDDIELWEFTIRADRFLRNMVRAVVGTLIDVGRGVLSLADFRKVIEKKDRCCAGMSVPGNALFLSNVEYPAELFTDSKTNSNVVMV